MSNMPPPLFNNSIAPVSTNMYTLPSLELLEPEEHEIAIGLKMLKLQSSNPDSPEMAACMYRLARFAFDDGDIDRADSLLKRVLVIAQKHYGHLHPILIEVYSNLAMVAVRQQNYPAAEDYACRSVSLCDNQPNLETVKSLNNLATVHCMQRNFPQAEIYLKHAISLLKAMPPIDVRDSVGSPAGSIMQNYRKLLNETGRSEEAAKLTLN